MPGSRLGLVLVLRAGSKEYGVGNRNSAQEIASELGVGLGIGARSWNRSKSKSKRAGTRCK